MVEVSKYLESFFSTTERLYLQYYNPYRRQTWLHSDYMQWAASKHKITSFWSNKILQEYVINQNMPYFHYQKTYNN